MVGVLEMGLRAVGADRLAFPLTHPERVDDRRAEQEHDQRRSDHRAAGAEGNVAEHIERCHMFGEEGEKHQHLEKNPSNTAYSAGSTGGNWLISALTILEKPIPFDDFTMMTSPGRTVLTTSGNNSSVLCLYSV